MIGDINKDFIYHLVLGDSDINWTLQLRKNCRFAKVIKGWVKCEQQSQ